MSRYSTPCLGCLVDCQELDSRRLCPDCAAERETVSEHPLSCDCAPCVRWSLVDEHRAILVERAAEWTLDREVGL